MHILIFFVLLILYYWMHDGKSRCDCDRNTRR